MEISRQEADKILENFSAGDTLLLQNEISHIPYIVHRAHQKRMIVWFNPSPINSSLICVDLRKIDYLVLNEAEGYFLTNDHRPTRMLDILQNRYPHLKIALTLGRDGSFYADEFQRLRQYAFITDEIDARAVGDTFLGYFLSRIHMGCTPWNALRTASIAAALAYAKPGAYTSIPAWEDVLSHSAAG
jgi:ribokinase